MVERLEASNIAPISSPERTRTNVIPAGVLVERLASVGANARLALSGRPRRRLLGLSAGRVIATDKGDSAVIPALFDTNTFLLGRDTELLVHEIRTSLAYLARYARGPGQPLWVIPVFDWMLDGPGGTRLLAFFDELASGRIDGIRVDHLDALLESAPRWRLPGELPDAPTAQPVADGRWDWSGNVDAIAAELGEVHLVDDLIGAFGRATALDERLALLEWLVRSALPPERTFPDVNDEWRDLKGHCIALLHLAQRVGAWRVMRLAGDLAGVVDGFLEVALMDLVVRQKRLAVGRSYSRSAVIDAPISNREIVRRIHAYCGDDPRERSLTQELVIHLGAWLRAEPDLFRNVITLRTGPLLQILVALRAREAAIPPSQALDDLVGMAPHALRDRLREAIDWRDQPERLEALHRRDITSPTPASAGDEIVKPAVASVLNRYGPSDEGARYDAERSVDWYHHREIGGAMSRLPERFYEGVWDLLGHIPTLVIGNRFDPRNVLESALYRGQSTSREHNFALAVEHRLNRIEAPEYRELNVEAIAALIEIVARTPELSIEEPLVLDVVVGHAVRLAWLHEHPGDEGRYDESRADAWQAFYHRSPQAVAHWVVAALDYLLMADVDSASVLEEVDDDTRG